MNINFFNFNRWNDGNRFSNHDQRSASRIEEDAVNSVVSTPEQSVEDNQTPDVSNFDDVQTSRDLSLRDAKFIALNISRRAPEAELVTNETPQEQQVVVEEAPQQAPQETAEAAEEEQPEIPPETTKPHKPVKPEPETPKTTEEEINDAYINRQNTTKDYINQTCTSQFAQNVAETPDEAYNYVNNNSTGESPVAEVYQLITSATYNEKGNAGMSVAPGQIALSGNDVPIANTLMAYLCNNNEAATAQIGNTTPAELAKNFFDSADNIQRTTVPGLKIEGDKILATNVDNKNETKLVDDISKTTTKTDGVLSEEELWTMKYAYVLDAETHTAAAELNKISGDSDKRTTSASTVNIDKNDPYDKFFDSVAKIVIPGEPAGVTEAKLTAAISAISTPTANGGLMLTKDTLTAFSNDPINTTKEFIASSVTADTTTTTTTTKTTTPTTPTNTTSTAASGGGGGGGGGSSDIINNTDKEINDFGTNFTGTTESSVTTTPENTDVKNTDSTQGRRVELINDGYIPLQDGTAVKGEYSVVDGMKVLSATVDGETYSINVGFADEDSSTTSATTNNGNTDDEFDWSDPDSVDDFLGDDDFGDYDDSTTGTDDTGLTGNSLGNDDGSWNDYDDGSVSTNDGSTTSVDDGGWEDYSDYDYGDDSSSDDDYDWGGMDDDSYDWGDYGTETSDWDDWSDWGDTSSDYADSDGWGGWGSYDDGGGVGGGASDEGYRRERWG